VIKKLNFSLPYGQKGSSTDHKPAPSRTNSENLPVPGGPSHQGKPGLKYPEPTPTKVVQYGGATSVATQPSISILRRNRDTEKAPAKSASTWIRNQKKCRTFNELIFLLLDF
jgi:hypothetical protein